MTRRPVLQITPYYPPHLGGLEKVVQELARRQSADRAVTVVTTDLRAPRGRRAEDGVVVDRLPALEFAHTPWSPAVVARLLRVPRGAVWHLHTAHAVFPELVALVAVLRGQRFVVHFHLDVDPSGPWGRLLPAYKRFVFGAVLRAAAGVIVLTATQADFVRRTYRVAPHRVFVVPNGVGDERFLPVRPRAGGPLRALFVGRLSPQKNLARLLDALGHCRHEIVLDIVGDGELRTELTAQSRRAGLANVRFHGRLDGDALHERFRLADVFVLASDKEGMSLAVLEAMAAGLPVVATRVPGNEELLRDVGLLAEPAPRPLAAALDRVAGDEQLRSKLAEASAAAASRYTWTAVAARVDEVYAQVLS